MPQADSCQYSHAISLRAARGKIPTLAGYVLWSRCPVLSLDDWERSSPALDWINFFVLNNSMFEQIMELALPESTRIARGKRDNTQGETVLHLESVPAHRVAASTDAREDNTVPLLDFVADASFHKLAGARASVVRRDTMNESSGYWYTCLGFQVKAIEMVSFWCRNPRPLKILDLDTVRVCLH